MRAYLIVLILDFCILNEQSSMVNILLGRAAVSIRGKSFTLHSITCLIDKLSMLQGKYPEGFVELAVVFAVVLLLLLLLLLLILLPLVLLTSSAPSKDIPASDFDPINIPKALLATLDTDLLPPEAPNLDTGGEIGRSSFLSGTQP